MIIFFFGSVTNEKAVLAELEKGERRLHSSRSMINISRGRTLTFTKANCVLTFYSLINVLKAARQPVPEALLKFGTTVKKKTHDVYGAFYKEIDETRKATKITFDD
jgi:hypothetical protein